MKKKLVSVIALLCSLIMCMGIFAACGTDWSKNVTLIPNGGEVSSNGGFVVAKGDYLYYINGAEDYTADNSFGRPVKGAVVVAKSDLSKKEVLVPKIIVSGDLLAGIYVYGDYVYYATPSNKKDTSGNVNNTNLILARTKLDGSVSEELATLSANDANYRFVEKSGNVYAYYVEGSALKVLSVNDKTVTDIVEEKFDSYSFLSNDQIGQTGYVVVYTQDVKDETRGEDAVMDYNEIYGVKAGETEAKLIKSGKKAASDKLDKSLTVLDVKLNNLIYEEKATSGEIKNFAYDLTGGTERQVYNLTALDGGYAVSLSEVYYAEGTLIYKATLLENKEPTAFLYVENLTSIIGIEGGNLYYTDETNYICRLALSYDNADNIRVSVSAVNTAWYIPEFIGGKIYYTDGEVKAVYRTDLSANVKTNDEDEDNIYKYIDAETLVGILTDNEIISEFATKVTRITGAISYDGDLEEIRLKDEIEEAKELYDKLVAEYGESALNESDVTKLKNYINALNAVYSLKPILYNLAPTEAAVNNVKEKLEILGEDNYNLLPAGYIGWYTWAVDKLAAEKAN